MIKQNDSRRWDFAEAFGKASWSSRNIAMLKLFDSTVENHQNVSFSEYGCGPHSPFSQAVLQNSNRHTLQVDRKDWGHGNLVVDFNLPDISIQKTDVGVLSGVLEYVNDIENVLKVLSREHNYLLISYACLNRKYLKSEKNYLSAIMQRTRVDGWRNHFTIDVLTNFISIHGTIEAAEFHRNQLMVVAKVY